MRKTYQLGDSAKAADVKQDSMSVNSVLKKTYIWQHLAQKKIKRTIKAKLKINSSKD